MSTVRTGEDGLHDPSQRPTVPLDETPDERAARLGESEQAEQEVEAKQQAKAERRKAKEEAGG